jgi:hypothetical protein
VQQTWLRQMVLQPKTEAQLSSLVILLGFQKYEETCRKSFLKTIEYIPVHDNSVGHLTNI